MITHNLFSTPVKIVSILNTDEITRVLFKAMHIGFKNCVTNNLSQIDADLIKNTFTKEVETYYKEATNKTYNFKLSSSSAILILYSVLIFFRFSNWAYFISSI